MSLPPTDTEIADLVRRLTASGGSDWAIADAIRTELLDPEVSRRVEEEYQDAIDEAGHEVETLEREARALEDESDEWERAHDEQAARARKLETEVERLRTRVTEVEAQLRRVGDVLSANGCDCDCDHHYEEHDDDCERCLACRVQAAMGGDDA